MFWVSGVGAIAAVWRPTPIDPIPSISNLPPAAKQLHGRFVKKSGENVKEYLLLGGF
jgi:hypothetical protein